MSTIQQREILIPGGEYLGGEAAWLRDYFSQAALLVLFSLIYIYLQVL